MNQQKKKRGENWSSEDKDILRQLIAMSANTLEDRSTKTNINIQKLKEWKNLTKKYNEITGKNRTEGEIKLAWKRMKMAAKANLSVHRQEQSRTGGGEKPPSPSPEDLAVMAIAPHDFTIEINNYDSDAALIHQDTTIQGEDKAVAGPSNSQTFEYALSVENVDLAESAINLNPDNLDSNAMPQIFSNPHIEKPKKGIKNRKEAARDLLVESNISFKKRNLEMLEAEHELNIQIAQLKIKKLKLQIDILKDKSDKPN